MKKRRPFLALFNKTNPTQKNCCWHFEDAQQKGDFFGGGGASFNDIGGDCVNSFLQSLHDEPAEGLGDCQI